MVSLSRGAGRGYCRVAVLPVFHRAAADLPGLSPRVRGNLLYRDLVAWIIPKNILSLVFSTLGVVQMPHKFTAARRHKFDKVQYRVINWAEY